MGRTHLSNPGTCASIVCAALLTAVPVAAQEDRHDWSVHLDLTSAARSTPLGSWLEGGAGKLRYDESSDSLTIGRLFLEYDGRLNPAWSTHVVADYVDDVSPGVDVTEAFVEWAPIPRSRNRQRLKLGLFYPPLSLENDGPGWSSRYAVSSSAINSWLAEEVRALGAEWRIERALGHSATRQRIGAHAATFFGNDPAGTLLAWKGWGIHDRQTRFGDVLPLPPVPQIQPGGMFENQAPWAEPFVETDDRPGYYYGLDWRHGRRALVALAHYDNRADPLSLRQGQYGWDTVFDHIGMQLELPGGVGLVAQWIDGTTVMGPVLDGARVVDTAFESNYWLLTKQLERHRVSVRYDDFAVVDRDEIPLDENDDSGHAWTLSYRYARSAALELALEWLRVRSYHPARAHLGEPLLATEHMLQLRIALSTL